MKRILASLLCLLLVLSMALAFVACDSVAGTLPDDGDKDTTPDNKPSDTKKPHTEEDAKTALVAMTAQLGTKKNFAADLTITVGTKQNGVNGSPCRLRRIPKRRCTTRASRSPVQSWLFSTRAITP